MGIVDKAIGAAIPEVGLGTKALGAVSDGKSWLAIIGLEKVLDSVEDPGFWVFLLGLIHFIGPMILPLIGIPYNYDSSLRIVFSSIILVVGCLLIFKGKYGSVEGFYLDGTNIHLPLRQSQRRLRRSTPLRTPAPRIGTSRQSINRDNTRSELEGARGRSGRTSSRERTR